MRKNLADRLAAKPPDPLYHYTNAAGLRGIATSKRIWASSIHYLNDSTEFAYALDQISQYLGALPASRRTGILRVLNRVRRLGIFVASFSARGDLLSQWRAYGPGTDGYSIGFSPVVLRKLALIQNFRLVPCVYSSREQGQILGDLLGAHPGMHSPSPSEATAQAFMVDLARVAPMLKDSAFHEEKEWRLVSALRLATDPDVSYREGRSFLVPYFSFPLTEGSRALSFKSVTVGPTPHPELKAHSAGLFLASKEVAYGPMNRSTVPYRSW